MKKVWIPLLTLLVITASSVTEARSRFCRHHPHAWACGHHHSHHHRHHR